MILLLPLLAAATLQQPAPPSGTAIAPAELRALCRGESTEPADFRTDAAHRLYGAYNRARCQAYLLGIAEGLRHAGRLCRPLPADAARRLSDAVLAAPDRQDVATLVEAALQPSGC